MIYKSTRGSVMQGVRSVGSVSMETARWMGCEMQETKQRGSVLDKGCAMQEPKTTTFLRVSCLSFGVASRE